MAMTDGLSSDDEFPEVEVIVQRRKQGTTCKDLGDDKGSAPRQPGSPESTHMSFDKALVKTPATARRRRRLGQSQPVDHSLLKPWDGVEVENGADGRLPRFRQPSIRPADRTEETDATATGGMMRRLPARTKITEARVMASSTVIDNPPEERKTRRLISRGAMKAMDLKVFEKEVDSLLTSDELESDAENWTEDEDSDFILRGDSSEALSISSQPRPRSPSSPRRLQRRVLSSSKTPAWAKSRQDESITLPKEQREKQTIAKKATTRKVKTAPRGDLEDFFKELKISYEDSEPERLGTGTPLVPILDPITPRKKTTTSPAKVPRIPMSPWKPEHKEFWDPEVNFAWIDKHSPPKKTTKKVLDLEASNVKDELKRKYGTSPEKKQAKKAFDAVKEDLARDFLQELDQVITDGKLAQLTEATGGLRIVWSNTLLTTAGRAHWKCKTTTTTSKQPSASSVSSKSTASTTTATAKSTTAQHSAHIELALKVLSNEPDLLNTVAHEFCHLAVFILHGKPKLAHGAEFKSYGQRVMRAASGIAATDGNTATLKTPQNCSVEINVTTRHSYEIEYRFVWRCADCGCEVHRHSRSVDPARHRCGRCKKGILVQVKPVPRGGKGKGDGENSGELGTEKLEAKGDGVQKRKKTAYQEFTSREMKALSVSHKNLSFKDKMALVSARWSERQKAMKKETEAAVPAAVSVRGLTAAVGVLSLDDDRSDGGGVEAH
ncbi:hypothetical protein F5B22DRAFT_627903 [Xylaria bambusicola]|uniref:uncharacterized protein n=1 Tax=Xylaria bambusicola TaxID=326684 RepID=UPI0020089CA2|nr:uncharacterized protein F5B22DRAFT_627903 [Xylaria bambusicola]KAI0505360.1 hypothetical protein F5B22DRAFT_627903 [Xylaria bambusicola]